MTQCFDQQPEYDRLINAEVTLQVGRDLQRGIVKGRSVDLDGVAHGNYNDNPMLNTYAYDVEFPYSQIREYSANIIAENMLTRVDEDGFSKAAIDSIINFNKDATALNSNEKFGYATKEQ